ncbi:hypothetical protein, partial [Alistipes finegoldii]|uniref:hypothetical protein n=1 Tax=Alistipes finegoldii TaxID=214856 RepID=UPI00242F6F21
SAGALPLPARGNAKAPRTAKEGLPVLAHAVRTQRTEYWFVLPLLATEELVGITDKVYALPPPVTGVLDQ